MTTPKKDSVKNLLAPKLRFREFKDYWEIGSLEPHIEMLSGIPLKGEEISEDENGVPILRGINITEGFIRHSKDIDRFYLKELSGIEKFLVSEGDLVIGMDGSKVGKNVAIVSKIDSGSILIQRVARIRSKPSSDIRFIYHHIFSPKFHRYVDEVNTSSGIPHISLKQINEFEIGWPSLPEQQKIAAFLSAVDEKIQQLTRKKELLEQYKKGVMQQLFSGKLRFKPDLTEASGDANNKPYPKWEEKRLGEVCFPITKGTTPKKFSPSGINFIKIESLIGTQVNLSKCLFIDQMTHEKELVRSILKEGDILFAIAGSVGKVGVVSKELLPANTNQAFSIIRLKDLKLRDFIVHILSSVSMKRYIFQNLSVGAQPNLNLEQVGNFKFLLPSIEEQQNIASFLTALDAKIESVNRQIAQTQTFKKGLLQQMFV